MERRNIIDYLRIIALTLCIISGVFMIATKIGHCEEGEVIYHPTDIPYHSEWAYSPFADNPQAQQNAINAIQQAFTEKGWTPDRYYLTFYSYSDNVYTCRIYYNGGKQNGMYEYGTYLMQDWLNGTSNRAGIIGAQTSIYLTSNGELYSNGIPTQPETNGFWNYFTNNVSTVTITKGSINRGIPVYMVGYLTDIIGNNLNEDTGNVTMTEAYQETPEWLEPTLSDVIDKTQLIAGDANATIDTLSQAKLGTWFQGVIDQIHNSNIFLYNNLSSLFSPFFKGILKFFIDLLDKVDNILDSFSTTNNLLTEIKAYIQIIKNDFEPEGIPTLWNNLYQASWVSNLTGLGTNLKTSIQGIGNVEPNAPVINANIPSNSLMGTGSNTINFAWYLDIKQFVQPIVSALMTVAFALYLYKQIPNIIHGVSGTKDTLNESAGKQKM